MNGKKIKSIATMQSTQATFQKLIATEKEIS